MALLIQRAISGLRPARYSRSRPPAYASQPDRILLGVRPGHRPSDKPPVRIYLGTERDQFRAERIFLWSIEKVRDPSRIYEIFLMRDIKGFKRGFWLTGFTNYRFAIPEFAGYAGRAIYNDADQIYLNDPAELFDLDMGKAGFLSINDRDTSVMLMDCQRMADVWNGHDVRRLSRKGLEARARAAGLWGELDGGWNARDSEYTPGQSMLVHFTTLHTQPWRPFPDQLVYFNNPTGALWPTLESEANAARFLPFSSKRPSRTWNRIRLQLGADQTKQDTLDYQALLGPEPPSQRYPKLGITNLLERVPDEDISWVLHRLMEASHELELTLREPHAHHADRYRRGAYFWLQHLAQASEMVPNCRWHLTYHSTPWSCRHYHGGPAQPGAIMVLSHHKPGHDHQALTIARALAERSGRPLLQRQIQPRHLLSLGTLTQDLAQTAVVVAAGWLPCQVAHKLQAKSPALRIVLAGRKSGPPPEHGGAAIHCRHFALPPHPNQVLTNLPLNQVQPSVGGDSAAWKTWQQWLNADHRVALLLGGPSRNVHFSSELATSLARAASAHAQAHNARLLVISSRRSAPILDAAQAGLSKDDLIYRWQPEDEHNPYALALSQAHQLLVTADSESMLADAVNSGKPLQLMAPGPLKLSLWQRFSAAVAARATRPHFNRRGSLRPQQGLNYVCARALARHWVLPPRDIHALRQRLCQQGLAQPFVANEAPVLSWAEDQRRQQAQSTFDDRINVIMHKLALPACDNNRVSDYAEQPIGR